MKLTGLFAPVLNMSITGCLLIGGVLLARLALKKAPKIFSYALWWVVLLRLLCPMSLPLPSLPHWEAPVSSQTATAAAGEGHREAARSPALPEPAGTAVPAPAPASPASASPRIAPILLFSLAAIVWFLGVWAMLLTGLVSALLFRRRLRGSCRLYDNVYLTDHLGSAFVVGLFSPKIYLPSDLPEVQRDYVLAHERHHIARLDPVMKHLFFCALCLHWFNPLVWLAFLLMGKDMEMSCDEAVLRKLGGHIRAEYSASLLRLAMGHRIVGGSPLCFGEGDTKGRIRNLARWRYPKKWQSILYLIVCAVAFTACAANPTRQVVSAPDSTGVSSRGSYQLPDGTNVYYAISSANTSQDSPEAVIRPITSDDIRSVAGALLGDVTFYEREPSSNPQYAKQQYQQMLTRWEPYADHLSDLVGASGVEAFQVQYQHLTEAARTALADAPEENPLTPCDWTLKKERAYNDCQWEIAGRPIEEDNDWLVATAEKDGLGYTYMVIRMEDSDYSLNRYAIQLGGASLWPAMDREIGWAKLCRTGEPTQAQIEAVQDRVMDMLEEMDLGQWAIMDTQVEVDTSGNEPEYSIHVEAYPTYRRGSTSYTFHGSVGDYLPTKAVFLMSANGDLLHMELDTPIEIKGN